MLNKVMLQARISNLGELKYTQSQKAVLQFSVAQNIGTGDNKKGHFFDCEAWEKTAEIIANNFEKGKEIIVEGELRQETWEKDGAKRSKVKLLVNKAHFTGSKGDGQGSGEHTAQTTSKFPGQSTYDTLDLDDDMDSVPF